MRSRKLSAAACTVWAPQPIQHQDDDREQGKNPEPKTNPTRS